MSAASNVTTLVPPETLGWLRGPDNPAVAVVTRRTLLHEPDTPELVALWSKRNEYAPVARILEAQRPDGSWGTPSQDYQKYQQGSLWQIHFLGELSADGTDPRVRQGAEYAFSRQLADGSWSVSNMRPAGSISCLTANVGRALARLGWATDERVLRAMSYVAGVYRDAGRLSCAAGGTTNSLNGYCHMVVPKLLLFLAEVPHELWPDGADSLRTECIRVLREREVFRCLPVGYREFQEAVAHVKPPDRAALREAWIAERGPLEYGDKSGWLRFGYPLSYNSDALEALRALAAVGEKHRVEYEPALEAVERAADPKMRWILRNTHNGKMLADVEAKGKPSKWLTLHALSVLQYYRG